MSTDAKADIKRTNPALAADLAIIGNQDNVSLRNMITALSMLPMMNTKAENERLAAAKRVLRHRNRRTK